MTGSPPSRRAVLSGIAFAAGSAGAPASPLTGVTFVKPILVFDIVETILDISALEPVFEAILGDRRLLRTWFDEFIVYMASLTLTGAYADAGKVSVAVLEMLAKTRGVVIGAAQLADFREASANLPPHPDVAEGLAALRQAGYRLVTLSNSPLAACETQLQRAGIRGQFERIFSVDEEVRRFKPARETYLDVARKLGVQPAGLTLVSCHAFDVMGAASAGLRSALLIRPGNAPFGLGTQPDQVVSDLPSLVRALAAGHH